MPPENDAEFHTALIRALARLVVAHEHNDAPRAVLELERLLTVITEHANPEARRNAGLTRAVLRV